MGKKTTKDILEMINNFHKSLEKKPTIEKMFEEIKMMKFKIKPIQGNLTEVNLNNKEFIKNLWKLGKLDEFFQKYFNQLSKKEKELFLKIFNDIYQKYQENLSKIKLQWERKNPFEKERILEIEIYKESNNKKFN